MAAGVFTITELRRQGGTLAPPPDAEQFEWSAGPDMPSALRGGARAAPLGDWNLGLTVNHVRTDYPGARTASIQVMSVRRKPFNLNGKWDDRWNFSGYARAEMDRMERMIARSRLCRFQFQGQVIDGLIVDADLTYKGDWLVRYALTVEPIGRPAEYQPNRSPEGPLTPIQRFDDAALSIAAMQTAADTVPAPALGGTVVSDVDRLMAGIVDARNQLGATLDQRDLRPNAQAGGSLARLSSQFGALGSAAQDMINALTSVRSDVEVAITTAADVLRFEDWSRSMRFHARIVLGRSLSGQEDMQERAEPQAARLYRPRAGESLYKISRDAYGTPHAWREIAARNGLNTITMTGDELLIIPERGAG